MDTITESKSKVRFAFYNELEKLAIIKSVKSPYPLEKTRRKVFEFNKKMPEGKKISCTYDVDKEGVVTVYRNK